MLSAAPGKELFQYTPDYTVFDLETTGLSTKEDKVVEFSALKVRGGTVTDEFTTLVNPERPIPSESSWITGITDKMVKDSPTFETVLRRFLDFAGDDILVGHNIGRFDLKFLTRDAQKYWGRTVGNDYIDTLPLARQYLPDLGGWRLTDLAEHYHIPPEGAHRALNDCYMDQQVYEKLFHEAKKPRKGQFICPKCGRLLRMREGKFGLFWGCPGYPDCRYTRDI